MININTRIIFDRKNTTKGYPKKEALLQIEVRLFKTSKRLFLSTGKKVCKNQFTYNNGNFICKDRPDATNITSTIRGMLRAINDFALTDRCKHLEDIKNYDKSEQSTESFIDFMKTELRNRNIELSTARQHLVTIGKVESFGNLNLFSDLTYNNICDFDAYLRRSGSLSDVSVQRQHTNLKIYVAEAIRKGKLIANPYNQFTPKRGKSKDPIFLTEKEIQLIKDYHPTYDYLVKAKDLFLFQCFTGLSYSDLMKFNKESVHIVDGHKAIQSNRQKTDENYITLFLPEAEMIAEKYNYNIPKINNYRYNDNLRTLSIGAGINKTMTSHTARHTFATYLLNKNIPIETVARALGHTNIKQTQHYARLLGKKVISDMSVLLKDEKKEQSPSFLKG